MAISNTPASQALSHRSVASFIDGQQYARSDDAERRDLLIGPEQSTTHNAENEQLAEVQPDPNAELGQRLVARPPNVIQRGISTRLARPR